MDAEHQLICAVVHTQSLVDMTEAGVSAEHFAAPTHKAVLGFILHHHALYSVVPAADTILEWSGPSYPDFRLEVPSEPIAVYLDRVKALYKARIQESGILRAISAWEKGDYALTETLLAATVSQSVGSSPRARAINLAADGKLRLDRYAGYADLDQGLRGIPTGIRTLDRATLGLQAGQLIVITALPKAGKTTLLSTMARNAHTYGYETGVDIVPLFYGFEMPAAAIAERLDAWGAGLDVNRLRAGELGPAEWARLEKSINALDGQSRFMLETGMGGASTLTEIAAKIDQYRPDIVFVDGIYLMLDEITRKPCTDWQAFTNVSQGFKRLAKSRDIPIVISSQNRASKVDKKTGADMNSAGYASSLGEDADLWIVLESTEVPEIKHGKSVGSRDTAELEFWMRWDWRTGIFDELDEDPFMLGVGASRATW